MRELDLLADLAPVRVINHKEGSMFRTALSIVVFSCLLCALPAAAAQSKSTARTAAKPASTAIVNLNTASATDLEGLPGIGAKTAARILEYRQKNGPFKKVEEILETSRSCPYSLSIFALDPLRSVSWSRGKSQQISR